MRWFGESWGAPVNERGEQVPLPSLPCALCSEPFRDGDRGLVLPFVGGPKDPAEAPYHLDCFRRCVTEVGPAPE